MTEPTSIKGWREAQEKIFSLQKAFEVTDKSYSPIDGHGLFVLCKDNPSEAAIILFKYHQQLRRIAVGANALFELKDLIE